MEVSDYSPEVRALHSTLLAHMSPLVRPTPSADYLGAQPAVAALALMLRNVIVTDLDGRVVTPVGHIINSSNPPPWLSWNALEGCYYVDTGSAREVVTVNHLGAFPAALIVCVQPPNAHTQ